MPDATDGLPLPLTGLAPVSTPSLGNTYLFKAIADATFIPADLKSFVHLKLNQLQSLKEEISFL